MSAPGELPRALQPWRPWLGWFEFELAVVLGDLVRRLADLVGDAAAASGRPTPEPDGLGDLRTRGSYERLIATEWLLADEMPEEFLRRAASSEHLFYAPSPRHAKVERRVVAIFDCGPRQLGAPRLAHLAAWILLARRAGDLGGELRWGVLQQPGRLHASDDEKQLKALLDARRLEPGQAGHVTQWREALDTGKPDKLETEVWWVGVTDTATPRPTDRRLTVHETFERGALDAAFAIAGHLRRARLPLPADPVATALLRGRIERPREEVAPALNRETRLRMALTRPPLFSRGGRHVALPALAGHAMVVLTVTSAHQKRGPTRRRQELSAVRPPVAMGLVERQATALCMASEFLYFWQTAPVLGAFAQRPPQERFDPPTGARWMPLAQLQGMKKTRLCVIDRQGRLIAWEAERKTHGQGPKVWDIDRNVLGFVPLSPRSLVYALSFGDRLWLRALDAEGDAAGPLGQALCTLEEARPPVWFSLNHGWRDRPTAIAVRRRAETPQAWWLFTRTQARLAIDSREGARTHEIELPPGERVVGVVALAGLDSAALVVISANKRAVRQVGPTGSTTLYEGAHGITQASVCPDSGRVAILTLERELIVVEPDGTVVMRARDDTQASAA